MEQRNFISDSSSDGLQAFDYFKKLRLFVSFKMPSSVFNPKRAEIPTLSCFPIRIREHKRSHNRSSMVHHHQAWKYFYLSDKVLTHCIAYHNLSTELFFYLWCLRWNSDIPIELFTEKDYYWNSAGKQCGHCPDILNYLINSLIWWPIRPPPSLPADPRES